jgi:hypothetical protein
LSGSLTDREVIRRRSLLRAHHEMALTSGDRGERLLREDDLTAPQ